MTFITGGEDGTDATTLPTWIPTGAAMPDGINDNAEGSLWDSFGFPTGVLPTGAYPIDFPKRAYNMIWNEFYRDEFIQDPVDITTSEMILYRNWEKDYFTSAANDTQLGTAPAISVNISGNVSWSASDFADSAAAAPGAQGFRNIAAMPTYQFDGSVPNAEANALAFFNNNDGSTLTATSVDITDLRESLRIQEWMERNMRAGVRYSEFLMAHYGVTIPDGMYRPMYIGGSKSPVVVSEVLNQADAGGDPVGQMAGHGITADSNFCYDFMAKEFGCVIGITSIMPRTAYQQGMPRQWWKDTKFDFYSPEFANLTEQAVLQGEIFADGVEANNDTVFGYQPAWDELKTKNSMICGQMRSTYDYWHQSRQFSSAPTLTSAFLSTEDMRKDAWAAPSEPAFIVNVRNVIKAIRPMPSIAIPTIA
jgi:hypothetical protein